MMRSRPLQRAIVFLAVAFFIALSVLVYRSPGNFRHDEVGCVVMPLAEDAASDAHPLNFSQLLNPVTLSGSGGGSVYPRTAAFGQAR